MTKLTSSTTKTAAKTIATRTRSSNKPASTTQPAAVATGGWKPKTITAGKGKSADLSNDSTFRDTKPEASKPTGIGGRGSPAIGGRGSIGGGGSGGRKK